VRQLRNTAQRLAAIARAGRTTTLEQLGLDDPDGSADHAGGAASIAPAAVPGAPGAAREAAEIDEDRLVATLREHRFQLNRSAAALGISRTHLDALIARTSRVRRANQLDRAEIAACVAEQRAAATSADSVMMIAGSLPGFRARARVTFGHDIEGSTRDRLALCIGRGRRRGWPRW